MIPNVLLAFWFAGTRESAHDVGIVVSGLTGPPSSGGRPGLWCGRHELGRQLGFAVRRLGNPVAWLDAQGRCTCLW